MLGKQIQDFITPCTKKKKKKKKRQKSNYEIALQKWRNEEKNSRCNYRLIGKSCNVNKPSFREQTGVIPPSQ